MNKDFVVKLLDDKTVPITHKRTCLKKYYEYYLEIDKTIADEIIDLIKEHNNIVYEYCLREKWYLQHQYYYRIKDKKKQELIKQNKRLIDN